jgi:hypothetical protein
MGPVETKPLKSVPVSVQENSNSCEANRYSASQEIPRLLRNPKIHDCVHKIPPLVPILSQMHPSYTFPPYFSKDCSNIISPSSPRSSEWTLSFRFSNQNIVCISYVPYVLDTPPISKRLKSRHPSELFCTVFYFVLV